MLANTPTYDSPTRLTMMFKHLTLTASLSALLMGWAPPALAATQSISITGYRYSHIVRFMEDARYESSGVVIYPRQAQPAKIYDVSPHQVLKKIFPASVSGNGNDQATSNALWVNLLSSGLALGGSGNVRAHDVSSDFMVNVTWPANPGKDYYFAFYEHNIPEGRYTSYAPKLQSGPNKDAIVAGNPKLLAVGDAKTLWLDADGSLSQTGLVSGQLVIDNKATTFSGGPSNWAGTPLTTHLSSFIGFEEGKLYFLEGQSTLHVYDAELKFQRTDEIRMSGELRSTTLGDVIDGKVKGVSYVGWDLGPIIGFFSK